jgi:hypothetical protein
MAHRLIDDVPQLEILGRLLSSHLIAFGRQSAQDIEADGCRLAHQNNQPVRQKDGFIDIMGDEDDRRTRHLVDAAEFDLQVLARHGIEGAEGFVHEKQVRLDRKRPRKLNALLHPSGQLPRVIVGAIGEIDLLQGCQSALLTLRLRSCCFKTKLDVSSGSSPRQQRSGVVLKYENRAFGRTNNALAVQFKGGVSRRLDKTAENPEQRRFTDPGFTKDTNKLAPGHFEIKAFDNPALRVTGPKIDGQGAAPKRKLRFTVMVFVCHACAC